ncbi:MAG: hypothetical protein A2X80_10985 [Geobacteraceae bacterium GWB2_52_12]|nr:MAG: hypothetical protein A2X80_10985 [Geobacteraceae bacterium GWB2_52_12]
MTEPVIIISGAAAVAGSKDKKKNHEENLKRTKTINHSDEGGDDNVDISKEARDRASGKKRKNILEYLDEN